MLVGKALRAGGWYKSKRALKQKVVKELKGTGYLRVFARDNTCLL